VENTSTASFGDLNAVHVHDHFDRDGFNAHQSIG
jgi:hypothetical protein